MSKAIIQQNFQAKYEAKNKLEKTWQDFLEKDTYLTTVKKRRFFNEVNQLAKFPRLSFFKFKLHTIAIITFVFKRSRIEIKITQAIKN